MEDQFLTVEQVSKLMQIHPYTVLKYVKQGKLKGVKLGRRYRIKKSDVDEFLEKHGVDKPPASKEAAERPADRRGPEHEPGPEPADEGIHKLDIEKKDDLFKIHEKKTHNPGLDSDHYIIE